MKNRIIITLFLIFCFISPSNAGIYDFTDTEFEKSFSEYYKNTDKGVQLEYEIAKFLEQKQTPISLDECLDVAMQNNFGIKTKFETYKSSEYGYKNALSKFLPELSYSWYSIYYNGQVLVGSALVDRFNETALSSIMLVRHNLFEGGKQIFDAKAAKYNKFEQKEKLNFTKEETLKFTAIYYWQLLQAKINIEIHIKNLYERIAQLKLTESLETAGMGTKFDVIRQKNEVASAKRSLVEAMNEFRLRQAKLANIMGIEIETTLYPIEKEVTTNKLIDENITIEELYETASKNRKDIKAIKNKLLAMKNEKRAIYTEFAPKPRVFYQFQNQGTARAGLGEANVLGLYVDVSLGQNLGVGTITRAKAKAHEICSVEYDLINKLRNIKEELLDSYYNSKLLLKRIELTNEQVEYATQSVKLAEMRLDAGTGILIDVIQAQSQKTVARIEHLQAVIDYNINQIELLFDEGIIDIEKIVANYNP